MRKAGNSVFLWIVILCVSICQAQHDTAQINTLNRQSMQLLNEGDDDSAFALASKALLWANGLEPGADVKKTQAAAYHNLGRISALRGNFSEALAQHQKALDLRLEAGDKKGIAASYNNRGLVHFYLGNYPQALQDIFSSLKMNEAIGDKRGIASSLNNIGMIYDDQADYPAALKYYSAALEIRSQIGDKEGIAGSYSNIGNIYYARGNYEAALANYAGALKMDRESGDPFGIATSLGNMGSTYLALAKYAEAERFFLDALQINTEMGNKTWMAKNYASIGLVYISTGKALASLEFFNKALAISKETGDKELIKNMYSGLAEADSALAQRASQMGQHRSVNEYSRMWLENYKMYIVYQDSLVNEENTKKTVQTQMQYEFDKKEAASKLEQEKKDALAAAETKKQRIILFAISGFGLLVLGFAIFAYRSFLLKKKANIEINKQKQLIEEKQKEILDSIHYAKRIQTALLPTTKYISRLLMKL